MCVLLFYSKRSKCPVGDHTATFPKLHVGCQCTSMAPLSKYVQFYPWEKFSLKALNPVISAAALTELYCSCPCVSALWGSVHRWYSLNNRFVEIDGKGSTTDTQRAEHSVLGMSQGSEELPLSAGCQSCSICMVRLREFSSKNFSCGVKKPLWEQIPQLLLPSQTLVHFPVLGNEWEYSIGTKFQQEPWRLSTVQYQYCTLQRAEFKWWKINQILINSFSPAQGKLSRNFVLALYTRSVRSTVNIWVGKEWSGSCDLCSPSCGIYGVTLSTQDLGAQGKEEGVGFSICCQTCFFQRLSGASHPAPPGNGSCEPPGILLKWWWWCEIHGYFLLWLSL